MKQIKDFFSINKMFIVFMIIGLTGLSLASTATKLGGIDIGTDQNLLSSFSQPIKIAYTILTAVQVLVTVGAVVTIIWQLLSFFSGNNVDIGKVLMFVVGGVVLVFLVWYMPKLFMKQAEDNNKTTGSVIKVERIVNVDKPLTFEKLK